MGTDRQPVSSPGWGGESPGRPGPELGEQRPGSGRPALGPREAHPDSDVWLGGLVFIVSVEVKGG